MSDNPEEAEYYLRFIYMYIDLCTECVYKVFLHYKPNTNNSNFFHANCKRFNELERRKILTQKEIQFLTSPVPRVETFDISLLIKLLSNIISSLPPPVKGWESPPDSSDISVAADLLRLRKIRNVIIGHRPRARLPKYKFDRLWEEVHQILQRITRAISPSEEASLLERIDYYMKRPLHQQQDDGQQYLIKLQEWWQSCEEVSDLQTKVDDLLQKTQELVLFFKSIPKHYCRYIRLLFEGGRSVLHGIVQNKIPFLTRSICEKETEIKDQLVDEELVRQVYPNGTSPNVDFESWDILTLATVMVHISQGSIDDAIIDEIRVIIDAVKNYAQTAITSLDSHKFQSCCEDLISSIKFLSAFVGDETKRQCKVHIENYRCIDGPTIDIDEYLDKMKVHAHDVKTISDIYKETLSNLKTSVKQMAEEGIVFRKDKDLHLKIITLGDDEKKTNLAEDILTAVWKSALEQSNSPEEYASVRHEVDKILEAIRNMQGVTATTVKRHCIILTLRCSSWSGLLSMLDFLDSDYFLECSENISSELMDMFGNTMILKGNITMESLCALMSEDDCLPEKKTGDVDIPISCSTASSMKQIFELLRTEKIKQSFRNIGEALSKNVDAHITVKANMDADGYREVFESEDVTTNDKWSSKYESKVTDDTKEVSKLRGVKNTNEESETVYCTVSGMTSFEARDVCRELQKRRRYIEEQGTRDLFEAIANAVKYKLEMNRETISVSKMKHQSHFKKPENLKLGVIDLLSKYKEQFSPMFSPLNVSPSKSNAMPSDVTEILYQTTISNCISGEGYDKFIVLFLYATATVINVPIYVFCQNEQNCFQWLYFPPLFEFKGQPQDVLSFISICVSPSNEYFHVRSTGREILKPKSRGLLGMYMAIIKAIQYRETTLPETPQSRSPRHWKKLFEIIDKMILEKCWVELSNNGFETCDLPELKYLVVVSTKAMSVVCKVLIKHDAFNNPAITPDLRGIVSDCKYVGCHAVIMELDQAIVERNSEFMNLDKTLKLEMNFNRRQGFGTLIGAIAGVILAPFTGGASIVASAAAGAALGVFSTYKDNKTLLQKVNIDKKEHILFEKLTETRLMFENAGLATCDTEQMELTRDMGISNSSFHEQTLATYRLSKLISVPALDLTHLSVVDNIRYQAIHAFQSFWHFENLLESVHCKHMIFNSLLRGDCGYLDKVVDDF